MTVNAEDVAAFPYSKGHKPGYKIVGLIKRKCSSAVPVWNKLENVNQVSHESKLLE